MVSSQNSWRMKKERISYKKWMSYVKDITYVLMFLLTFISGVSNFGNNSKHASAEEMAELTKVVNENTIVLSQINDEFKEVYKNLMEHQMAINMTMARMNDLYETIDLALVKVE